MKFTDTIPTLDIISQFFSKEKVLSYNLVVFTFLDA